MNKKKIIITTLACSLLCAASFSTAYALYVSTPNNIVFGIAWHVNEEYTITYHLPTTNGEFSNNTIEVVEGTNLYSALSSHTSNIDSYEFIDWRYSSDHFRNDDENSDPVSNSTLVENDIEVWGKFAEKNVVYYHDGDDHYLSESLENPITINARNIYYGNHIYSMNGVEGTGIDTETESGIYNIEKEGNAWFFYRRIDIYVGNVSSWWYSDGAKFHIAIMRGFIEDWRFSNLTFTYDKTTIWVPISSLLNYNKFNVVRNESTEGSFTNIWTQTTDITLDGGNKYSATNHTITIYDTETDGKKNWQWTSD